MKNNFYKILVSLLSFSPTAALAQTNGGLANLDDVNLNGDIDLINLIGRVINVLLGFLGVVVLVGIIYGGFKMMTSGGNDEQSAAGKKIVGAGVVGLVIIVASLAIANFVIYQLQQASGSTF